MIKLRNQADFLGDAYVQTGNWAAANPLPSMAYFMPMLSYLIGVQAWTKTAGTGTTPTWDILVNGTSILSATKMGMTASVRESSYGGVFLAANPILNRGDIVEVQTISTWGTTQSVDFIVELLFRNAKQSPPGAVLTGDFYNNGDGI